MIRSIYIILLLVLPGAMALAQSENSFIRQGNKLYEKGKFNDAEIDYRKAIENSPKSVKGAYNLGNSLYSQDKYEEAVSSFSNASVMINPDNKAAKAGALHNLGNALLKSDKLQESVEAYKQALRLNPNDEDTRYNLAYAMRKMQQQQQQQQQQGDDNKDDNQDKKDQQQQQNPSDSQDNQQQDKQQQQKPQISKQDAERMLQALKNDEQKTLDKVNQQKVKSVQVQIEKDW